MLYSAFKLFTASKMDQKYDQQNRFSNDPVNLNLSYNLYFPLIFFSHKFKLFLIVKSFDLSLNHDNDTLVNFKEWLRGYNFPYPFHTHRHSAVHCPLHKYINRYIKIHPFLISHPILFIFLYSVHHLTQNFKL